MDRVPTAVEPLLQYRVLGQPAFRRPIYLRFTVHADGSGELLMKTFEINAVLKPGTQQILLVDHCAPGELHRERREVLSRAKTHSLIQQLERIGFWTMGSTIFLGTDGDTWTMEGIDGERWHFVAGGPRLGGLHGLVHEFGSTGNQMP